jgi:hypothetical protein
LPSYVPGAESPAETSGSRPVTWAGGVAMEPLDRVSVAQLLRDCYVALERYADAEPYAVEVYYGHKAVEGPDHGSTRGALDRLLDIYVQLGAQDKVAEYRRLLNGS